MKTIKPSLDRLYGAPPAGGPPGGGNNWNTAIIVAIGFLVTVGVSWLVSESVASKVTAAFRDEQLRRRKEELQNKRTTSEDEISEDNEKGDQTGSA